MKIVRYAEVHGPAILEIYSHYVLHSVFTFDLEPPSLKDFNRKLLSAHVCLVGIEAERILGYTYASGHRQKKAYDTVCETGIYMDRDSHGTGHGTRLYQTLLNLLEVLGYYTALGGVTVPNRGSEKLHKKLGFHRAMCYENIGYKHGAWRSVAWWRKDLSTFNEAPESPRSIEQLSEAELTQMLA